MKPQAIELNPELAAQIEKALRSGHYVLFTRGGRKVAYVLPAKTYDEEDIAYMTDPEFWKSIDERDAREHSIALEEIEPAAARSDKTRRGVPKNSAKP